MGTQHAELNAYSPARLSQDVCLISGETIGYTMSHRRRENATIGDVSEFNIDSTIATNIVVEPSTTHVGTGGMTNIHSSGVRIEHGTQRTLSCQCRHPINVTSSGNLQEILSAARASENMRFFMVAGET
jgi:hypothetical protein